MANAAMLPTKIFVKFDTYLTPNFEVFNAISAIGKSAKNTLFAYMSFYPEFE